MIYSSNKLSPLQVNNTHKITIGSRYSSFGPCHQPGCSTSYVLITSIPVSNFIKSSSPRYNTNGVGIFSVSSWMLCCAGWLLALGWLCQVNKTFSFDPSQLTLFWSEAHPNRSCPTLQTLYSALHLMQSVSFRDRYFKLTQGTKVKLF